MKNNSRSSGSWTAGLDVGDRWTQVVVLNRVSGERAGEERIGSSDTALRAWSARWCPMQVVLETGAQSPWMSRLLSSLGHEVIVADSRQLPLIGKSRKKTDVLDAETLARLARVEPALLHPVRHRSEAAQRELEMMRARDLLVRMRTMAVSHVRGAVKAIGGRLPKCSTEAFAVRALSALPESLRSSLQVLLEMVAELTEKIGRFDRETEELSRRHPETERLRQVAGVGTVTAVSYVLTIETPERFARSREVGSYLGLAPGVRDSGQSQPQLRITKQGDAFLRKLLVQAAQYILGPFAPDCDLRRFGEALAKRGGKAAKKRAVVAVARKLAVLLHRLWVTGAPYEPLRGTAPSA
jgi:transposase